MMRYPGGKLRLQKKINVLISEVYDCSTITCVGEPFTGGGGSLINMAEAFPHWKFRINDLNPDVLSFWSFFVYASEQEMSTFYDQIRATKPTQALYTRIFHSIPITLMDRAFRLLFLNKTSYGGYITHCLPIGGKTQAGKWKVDVYWSPEIIIKKCERARRALFGRVFSVDGLDCNTFITRYKFDFVYGDPPYILYGKQWYNCKFDIETLREFRKNLNLVERWCVSMDEHADAVQLFNEDNIQYVDIKHTAKSANGVVKSARELVVFPK